MNEPSKAMMLALRVAAAVFMYLATTLATAALATHAPGDVIGAFFSKLVAPLAAALPGASMWGNLIDLNGKIAGALPTPVALLAGFVALAAGAWTWAGKISQQIRSDAAIARDEAIRLGVRAKAHR